MTQKDARKIMLWKGIERYRTAGGREEHHTYKEALDNYIDDMDEVAHPAPLRELSDSEIRAIQAEHPTENDPMPFARAVLKAAQT